MFKNPTKTLAIFFITVAVHQIHAKIHFNVFNDRSISYKIFVVILKALRLIKNDEVHPDQGDAIVVILFGKQKFLFKQCLFKYLLKSMLIIEIYHTTYLKYLGKLSVQNFAKHRHFERLAFGRKINQWEVIEI